MTTHDVVVVGGGQAGLAVGYHLRQHGLHFVILDAGPEVGHVWRSRWDSLALFTPAQYSGLPGLEFPAERDTYPTRDDVAAYLESYVATFDLPLRLNARVRSVAPDDGGYAVATEDDLIRTNHVIVATGPFQVPFVPPMARGLDSGVVQIHSADYRSPAQIPQGRVLVVGGGNSGFQIAEELAATRTVDLAIGKRMPPFPQRLLGRDIFWWLTHIGMMKVSVESRIGRRMAQRDVLIGSSRRRILSAGVTLRPRLESARGPRATFADGTHLDVESIVWATGYRSDYSWLQVPGITDERGDIIHRRGVTPAPGLLLLGLPWQHTRGSALLGFVNKDAEFIADLVAESADDGAAGATIPERQAVASRSA
jgi:putative flavoprotein involved in K+ transport